jgi:hypothetical protein
VTGVTSKTSYAPGETVSVTVSGGYRTGWVRAALFDQNSLKLAVSSGNASGMGSSTTFPAILSALAPTTPGTYTWKVGWYGNRFDTASAAFGSGWRVDPGNAEHGYEMVNTNSFTVTSPSDTTVPVLGTFTLPAVATALTVPISISATDNMAVSGYLITESEGVPAATSEGWSTTAPTSHTFTSAGAHTLYAFAKDTAGNVSERGSASVDITLTLVVQTDGSGSGAVNSDPAGIACASNSSSGCSANFTGGSVNLITTPGSGSTFEGWSGVCSGAGACSVIMDAGKTVTATFTQPSPVRTGTRSYQSLQAAYDDAVTGDSILMMEGVSTGSLTARRPITVTIKGGYSSDYQADIGETVVTGKLSLQSGTVMIEKVKVR